MIEIYVVSFKTNTFKIRILKHGKNMIFILKCCYNIMTEDLNLCKNKFLNT